MVGGFTAQADVARSASPAVGGTFWLTGLPSGGKSTIATGVAERLAGSGHAVETLDGDRLRQTVCGDLGFSRPDREENVRRVGDLALALARGGAVVLVAVIAPYARCRAAVRARHAERRGPLRRDLRQHPARRLQGTRCEGLYARHAAGGLTGLTGVDDPCEHPRDPHLDLPAHCQTVDESVARLHRFVLDVLAPG